MTDLKVLIQNDAKTLFPKILETRAHLHQHPELSYQEYETMAFVSAYLNKLGIQHEKGVGQTGVVALIHPESGPSTTCIGLRADLDALPIQEENEVSYKSKIEGVMHACGHDVHTSILLGAAEIIQKYRSHLKQSVKLIFQPGEEKNPGGATYMIKDGVLENPKITEMYALHVFPDLETGKFGFKDGLYMASCDEIYLTIHGKGGHGATPQNCIDPIMIGANILTNLQQVISRKGDPTIPSVLSFGHFEALGATNVIPSKAILKGTFRTMNEKWRAEAHQHISQIANEIAHANGASIDVLIDKGYPFLVNDAACTEKIKSKAIELVNASNVVTLPLRMTSEDFAYYSQEVPVCFFRLGVRNEAKGITYGVHHPKFDIDSEALIYGTQLMAYAVF